MGNCLKTEASDDESLLGDSDEGERQSRRNRRNRRRTRVQGYMANNAPSIPDPTHYFNLGMYWQASYRKHSFLIHKRPIVWVRIRQMFSQFYYGSNAFFSFNFSIAISATTFANGSDLIRLLSNDTFIVPCWTVFGVKFEDWPSFLYLR